MWLFIRNVVHRSIEVHFFGCFGYYQAMAHAIHAMVDLRKILLMDRNDIHEIVFEYEIDDIYLLEFFFRITLSPA